MNVCLFVSCMYNTLVNYWFRVSRLQSWYFEKHTENNKKKNIPYSIVKSLSEKDLHA